MTDNSTATQVESDETKDLESAGLELAHLDGLPITHVSISSLLFDNSPRQGGKNDEHARMLAESEEQLPPIVVHGQSMQVIDGVHRVRAAIMRGEERIEARIYYGTDDDAFVLAVRMNITHGLPLTLADRTAAAIRIIGSHPQWSDRMIATAVGLSAGTVGKVRRRSTVQDVQSNTRVGKDGRVRPVDSAAGRLKVTELLAERPTSPIRAIAKEAGVSLSTVHAVRRRLHADQHPTAENQGIQELPTTPERPDLTPSRGVAGDLGSPGGVDVAAILADLKKDSLLQRDPGQSLLRCLARFRVEVAECSKIVEMVPDHCASSVAKLACEYARVWTKVAAQLEKRCLRGLRGHTPQPRT